MLDIVDPSGILAAALPRVCPPLQPIATVRAEIAREFGFSPKTLVSCGSGGG